MVQRNDRLRAVLGSLTPIGPVVGHVLAEWYGEHFTCQEILTCEVLPVTFVSNPGPFLFNMLTTEVLSTAVATPKYDREIVAVAEYVHHYKITDSAVYQKARIALQDALGCAIETVSKSAGARSLLGPTVPGSKIPNGFRLPGTGYTLDPVKGAFDLGVLIRYLDHNDALGGAEWGHPSGKRAVRSLLERSRALTGGVQIISGPSYPSWIGYHVLLPMEHSRISVRL